MHYLLQGCRLTSRENRKKKGFHSKARKRVCVNMTSLWLTDQRLNAKHSSPFEWKLRAWNCGQTHCWAITVKNTREAPWIFFFYLNGRERKEQQVLNFSTVSFFRLSIPTAFCPSRYQISQDQNTLLNKGLFRSLEPPGSAQISGSHH